MTTQIHTSLSFTLWKLKYLMEKFVRDFASEVPCNCWMLREVVKMDGDGQARFLDCSLGVAREDGQPERYRSEVALGLENKHLLLFENTLALSANPKEVKCRVR